MRRNRNQLASSWGKMFGLIQQAQSLLSAGSFDHEEGRMSSLEMVDPMGSWNEGSWGMSPFNGEVSQKRELARR